MRQVPQYAIIGNGRVAKHFCHYFSLLGISYQHWHRQLSQAVLSDTLNSTNHILILISDSAIEGFIAETPMLIDKTLIHFSAAHQSQLAYTAHPLMTFSHEPYDLETYINIPFILNCDGPEFSKLLPGLPNKHYCIAKDLQIYYHSLCVIANNFSSILWKKFFSELSTKFNIPKAAGIPILQQTFKNILNDHDNALTGPLVRNDVKTLKNNMESLKDDSFHEIFQAFIDMYQQN